jgi:hypothetical protein
MPAASIAESDPGPPPEPKDPPPEPEPKKVPPPPVGPAGPLGPPPKGLGPVPVPVPVPLPPADVPPISPDPDPVLDEPPRLPVAVPAVPRTVWVAESIGFVTEPPEEPLLPDPEVVVVFVGADVTLFTVFVTVVVVSLTVVVGLTGGGAGALTVGVGVVVEVEGTRTVVVGTVDVTELSVLVTGSVEGSVTAAGTLTPPATSRAKVPSAHSAAIRLRLPIPIGCLSYLGPRPLKHPPEAGGQPATRRGARACPWLPVRARGRRASP